MIYYYSQFLLLNFFTGKFTRNFSHSHTKISRLLYTFDFFSPKCVTALRKAETCLFYFDVCLYGASTCHPVRTQHGSSRVCYCLPSRRPANCPPSSRPRWLPPKSKPSAQHLPPPATLSGTRVPHASEKASRELVKLPADLRFSPRPTTSARAAPG